MQSRYVMLAAHMLPRLHAAKARPHPTCLAASLAFLSWMRAWAAAAACSVALALLCWCADSRSCMRASAAVSCSAASSSCSVAVVRAEDSCSCCCCSEDSCRQTQEHIHDVQPRLLMRTLRIQPCHMLSQYHPPYCPLAPGTPDTTISLPTAIQCTANWNWLDVQLLGLTWLAVAWCSPSRCCSRWEAA